MITTSSLNIAYGPGLDNALSDVSISVARGSVCALLGPTGSGKTTLLYALSGLLGGQGAALQASGSISIDSRQYSPIPMQPLFPDVMMLLQEPHLQCSGMTETVEDEVQWTLENLGMPLEQRSRRTATMLDALHISHLRRRLVRTLSGGELHRVALASVLVVEPKVLLLDEPASSLDQNARQTLLRIITSITQQTTVLFTDTDADIAFRAADRILLLNDGRVVFSGTRSSFRGRLREFVHLLPLDEWIMTSEQLDGHPSPRNRQRLLSLLEGK